MIAYVNGGAACYRLEKNSRGVLLTSIFKQKNGGGIGDGE